MPSLATLMANFPIFPGLKLEVVGVDAGRGERFARLGAAALRVTLEANERHEEVRFAW